MSATSEEKELQWDDPSLRDSQPEYDPDADANLYKLPPDTEDYDVKVRLGEKGIYPKKTEKSGAFAVAEIEIIFVAPGEWFDGRRACTEYVTSITMKDSGTSSFVNLLRLTGNPPQRGLSLPDLAEFGKEVLGAEPLLKARFQWIASSRDVQEANQSQDDENHEKYKASRYRDGVFLAGMKNFPQREDGSYNPEVTDPISGAEVRGRLKLLKFMERK